LHRAFCSNDDGSDRKRDRRTDGGEGEGGKEAEERERRTREREGGIGSGRGVGEGGGGESWGGREWKALEIIRELYEDGGEWGSKEAPTQI